MGEAYTTEKIKEFPKEVYLDKQKDIKVIIGVSKDNKFIYTISARNLKNDNLLKNITRLTQGKYNSEAKQITGILK